MTFILLLGSEVLPFRWTQEVYSWQPCSFREGIWRTLSDSFLHQSIAGAVKMPEEWQISCLAQSLAQRKHLSSTMSHICLLKSYSVFIPKCSSISGTYFFPLRSAADSAFQKRIWVFQHFLESSNGLLFSLRWNLSAWVWLTQPCMSHWLWLHLRPRSTTSPNILSVLWALLCPSSLPSNGWPLLIHLYHFFFFQLRLPDCPLWYKVLSTNSLLFCFPSPACPLAHPHHIHSSHLE